MEKEGLTLEEQRDNIRDEIWRATGRKDYAEAERLEDDLVGIEELIRSKE